MPPRLNQPSAPKSVWSLFRSFASDSTPPPRNKPSSTASLLGLSNPSPKRGPLRLTNRNADQSKASKTAGIDAVTRMHERFGERRQHEQRGIQKAAQQARERAVSASYLKHMPRRWGEGDVYSPTELSPAHQKQWRRRPGRNVDLVDVLGLRPMDMYKNFSLIQAFTRSDGYIANNYLTALRPVNQRKVAKMVRRAQGMGIYPTVHGHPEMLRNQFFPPTRFGRM